MQNPSQRKLTPQSAQKAHDMSSLTYDHALSYRSATRQCSGGDAAAGAVCDDHRLFSALAWKDIVHDIHNPTIERRSPFQQSYNAFVRSTEFYHNFSTQIPNYSALNPKRSTGDKTHFVKDCVNGFQTHVCPWNELELTCQALDYEQ
eukprot:5229036-Amphidinium_carterae.1